MRERVLTGSSLAPVAFGDLHFETANGFAAAPSSAPLRVSQGTISWAMLGLVSSGGLAAERLLGGRAQHRSAAHSANPPRSSGGLRGWSTPVPWAHERSTVRLPWNLPTGLAGTGGTIKAGGMLNEDLEPGASVVEPIQAALNLLHRAGVPDGPDGGGVFDLTELTALIRRYRWHRCHYDAVRRPEEDDVVAEQAARNMLERMGVEKAQERSAGDVVELANLINDHRFLKSGQASAPVVKREGPPPPVWEPTIHGYGGA